MVLLPLSRRPARAPSVLLTILLGSACELPPRPLRTPGPSCTHEHVRPSPARDGHQAALGAACREPAVCGGVPELVRVEAHHARGRRTLAERLVQGVVAEPLAAVPEPQVRLRGEAVRATQAQVAVERE